MKLTKVKSGTYKSETDRGIVSIFKNSKGRWSTMVSGHQFGYSSETKNNAVFMISYALDQNKDLSFTDWFDKWSKK